MKEFLFLLRQMIVLMKFIKWTPDDLDDMYVDIAQKLGISTENPEANPYWNRVTTVKNLVLFLHNQPKIKAQ